MTEHEREFVVEKREKCEKKAYTFLINLDPIIILQLLMAFYK